MFSDDLVLSRFLTTYLLLIYKIFKKKWVLFSSYDFKRDENVYFGIVNGRKPKWNDKLLYGINTISSPSVMSFVNFENNLFDNNLNLLMDCEFYFRLKEKYEILIILTDSILAIGFILNMKILFRKNLGKLKWIMYKRNSR